jgi:hypothetical protein
LSGADEEDAFLSRWSRRKVAARRGEALPEPVTPPAAPAAAQAPPPAAKETRAPAEAPPELPSLDTLKGLESDYKAFMRPEVDAGTRTAALKKLFGDPHFNTMDRLDVYIDDYSIPDPIPAAVLKTLSGARMLGLFDDEEKKAAAAPAAPEVAAPGLPDAPAPVAEASPPQDDAPAPADPAHEPDAA